MYLKDHAQLVSEALLAIQAIQFPLKPPESLLPPLPPTLVDLTELPNFPQIESSTWETKPVKKIINEDLNELMQKSKRVIKYPKADLNV